MAILSPTDIWASGTYQTGSGQSSADHGLIEHWDGSLWRLVPSQNPGSTETVLWGRLAAVSGTDVWAFGHYRIDDREHALVEHWSGSKWSVVPDTIAGDNLDGAIVGPGHDLWAFGVVGGSNGGFIERRTAAGWVAVPTRFAQFGGLQVTGGTIFGLQYLSGDPAAPLRFARWSGTSWVRGEIPGPSAR